MSTQNWKNALQKVASLAQPGDIIFHGHSHHGSQIDDPDSDGGLESVWCPNDFDFSPEKMITSHWMAALVGSLKPNVKWVDHADCCHSGSSMRMLRSGKQEKYKYIPNHALIGKQFTSVRTIVVSGPNSKGTPSRRFSSWRARIQRSCRQANRSAKRACPPRPS